MQSPPVTIVIPTHQRHALLALALEQYADSGMPVLVADSSDSPLDPAALRGQVDYRHMPGVSFLEKLHQAALAVHTPLLVMRADNRLLDAQAIITCARHLLDNPELGAVQGLWVTAMELPGRLSLTPNYHLGRGLDASTPSERLLELYSPYVPSFYAVQRTENWQEALGLARSGIKNFNALELFTAMHAALCGKQARLPLLYALTLGSRRVSAKSAAYDDFSLVATQPAYAGEFAYLVTTLGRVLAVREGLPQAQAEATVHAAIDLHLRQEAARPGRRPLWRKLPKYLRRAAETLRPALARERLQREALAERATLEKAVAEAGPEALDRLDQLLALGRRVWGSGT